MENLDNECVKLKHSRLYLVVQRVGEAGRLVLVDWHGAVVGEVCVVHHGVHVVAPDGEEGRSHAPGHLGSDTSRHMRIICEMWSIVNK